MDTNKLKILTEFAEEIRNTPKDQLMKTFMSLNLKAKSAGVRFSDQETDLLITILTTDMNPGERKNLETMRMLIQKMSKR